MFKFRTKIKSTRNPMKKKLTKIFNLHIRLRDVDETGTGLCISCGRRKHITDLECGHYHNCNALSICYDETNCNAQCVSCNCYQESNRLGYNAGFIKKYGKDAEDKLLLRKNTRCRLSTFEYEHMIKHYYKEAKKLADEKNLTEFFEDRVKDMGIIRLINK